MLRDFLKYTVCKHKSVVEVLELAWIDSMAKLLALKPRLFLRRYRLFEEAFIVSIILAIVFIVLLAMYSIELGFRV